MYMSPCTYFTQYFFFKFAKRFKYLTRLNLSGDDEVKVVRTIVRGMIGGDLLITGTVTKIRQTPTSFRLRERERIAI